MFCSFLNYSFIIPCCCSCSLFWPPSEAEALNQLSAKPYLLSTAVLFMSSPYSPSLSLILFTMFFLGLYLILLTLWDPEKEHSTYTTNRFLSCVSNPVATLLPLSWLCWHLSILICMAVSFSLSWFFIYVFSYTVCIYYLNNTVRKCVLVFFCRQSLLEWNPQQWERTLCNLFIWQIKRNNLLDTPWI